MTTSMYMQGSYEDYKRLEDAMKTFKESVHTSTGGFYHKSIRVPWGDLTIEFHGPLVKAAEDLQTESMIDVFNAPPPPSVL